jgi:hypothetical protein
LDICSLHSQQTCLDKVLVKVSTTLVKMAPAASSNPAVYEKNEKVLCFHHELLYEAKVMDDPQREDEKDKMSPWKYRVHYKGWKNT